ncbi:MAG: glycerophosphodiester phosphodiesterase [Myxococcales bacterium]|nr:glycerophosphodiester phosphodiesterase [Myxococcales bacterium]
MFAPPSTRPTRPRHIAHRGGAGLYPENTLYAFRAAVSRHRTEMLELDVHLLADGEVVVWHDNTLDRCSDGTGPIATHRWPDLAGLDAGYRWTPDGATFPFRGKGIGLARLVDVLRAFPNLPINLELKPADPATAAPLADLLRAEGAVERVCVGSEHDTVAAALHQALPAATHFYPREALTRFVMTVLTGGTPEDDPRWRVLDMPAEYGGTWLITPALLEAAHARDRAVNVWTIDDQPTMARLCKLGVDGIMTDRPDRLRAVLDAR